MRSQGQVTISPQSEGRASQRAVIEGATAVHAGPDTTILVLHTCDRCQYFGTTKGLGPNLCQRENRNTADTKTNATPVWCPFDRHTAQDAERIADAVSEHYRTRRLFAVKIHGQTDGLHPSAVTISFLMVKNVEQGSKPLIVVPGLVSVSRRSIVDGAWFPAGFIRWSTCGQYVLAEFPDDISPGLSRRAWLLATETRNCPPPC